MTHLTTTEWKCDRCAMTIVRPQNEQPDFWHRLSSANPPKHAEPQPQGDICDECWDSFCEWFRGADR